MAEPHHNVGAFRPNAFNPQHQTLAAAAVARPLALSDNEPIDQFIQTGGGDYYPSGGYGAPSEQDYFSLFAEFAMDLTPPASIKSFAFSQQQQQQPPVLGKTGLAPTYSTTAVPPEALNAANRKRKKDGVIAAPVPAAAPAPKASSAKKSKKDLAAPAEPDDSENEGLGDSDSLPEREKRLLKNRKAAQQFRKRQKNHILELESRVDTLSTENSTLTSQVGLLRAENKLIREQLDYMRSFVLNALQFSFPPNMPLQDIQKTIMPLALSRDLGASSGDKDGSSQQNPHP